MRLKQALVLTVLSCASIAHGQDVFDRSAEVDKYIKAYTEGPQGVLAETGKEIYISGLSDPRLASAIRDRLFKDLGSIKRGDRADTAYAVWNVKALASFGIPEYAATLQDIRKNSKTSKVKSEAGDELDRIAWHKRKNEIMASTRNYKQGDNARLSRYLNLIMDDDFTYKYQGADRVNWEKLLEPRVLDEMAKQLLQYKDTDFPMSAGKAPTKTLGLYAKLLGRSGQTTYRETLQQVVDSSSGMLIKKHAREALDMLK